VPLFLDQLIETLREEQNKDLLAVDAEATPTTLGGAAALEVAELLHRVLSVDQVVRGYADLRQCVTALAVEQAVSLSTDEFRTLNHCLDNALAESIAPFGVDRHPSVERRAATWQQRLDDFAAEHQRLIEIAIQAFSAIKTGNVKTGGATGALLDHTLRELRSLADRTLPKILPASPKHQNGGFLGSGIENGDLL
jgi:hypothetical protein